jgi:hypothetical protein
MRHNSKIVTLGAMLALTGAGAHAQTIADWDFDAGGAIAAPYNTPAATSGTGSATQLGMTNPYTYNTGEGPGSVANCDVLASAGASTGSGSYGWRVRGNSNAANSGPGEANGWNSAAPIGTQGAEFSASTVGYSGNISISADINATGQAERNLAIEYTLDGNNWVNATITSAGTLATLANNTTSPNTIMGNYVELSGSGTGWNNLITATVPATADNDPNFAIEIVNASTGADDVNTSGNPLNNSSGNWRFDNIDITATAVPEPSVMALLGVALPGICWQIRRGRKS